MSQHDHILNLPLGNYNGAKFAGRCDEYSIRIAAGSSARDMDIAGLRFARIDAPGVDLSGLKGQKSSIITLNAPGSTLSNAQLNGATLGMTSNFSGATIEGSGAQKADFSEMNAKGVNFSQTSIKSAVFDGSNLEGAKFESAKMQDVNFKQNNLRNGNFRNAKLKNVHFTVSEEEFNAAMALVEAQKRDKSKDA